LVKNIQFSRTHKRNFWSVSLVVWALLISGCATTQRQATALGEKLRVPAGFAVETLTTQVPNARAMAEGRRGTIFVGSYAAGNVYALTLRQGRVSEVRTLLKGLASPTSIAVRNDALFVATTTRVLRYDNIEDRLDNPPNPVVVIDGLLNQRTHAARYMAFGPDDKLYLNLSAPCDWCEPMSDEFALIIRTHPDGSNREVVARGVRNTGGFDWRPKNGELWFTQTETDELADSRVSEELNRVAKVGQHFGFPYCRSGDLKDPKFGDKRACEEFVPPIAKLGGHTAPLGMKFYSGISFPSEFQSNIFIARHGSHDAPRIGYDVLRYIPNENGKSSLEPFVEGFLDEKKNVLGRPVGLLELRDGSLLISDDQNGAVYRVRYVR
jgi:glucose/arabinose dehydrogenase